MNKSDKKIIEMVKEDMNMNKLNDALTRAIYTTDRMSEEVGSNKLVSLSGLKSILEAMREPGEKCPKCETDLEEARGIGLYCPNKDCEVVDNVEPEKKECKCKNVEFYGVKCTLCGRNLINDDSSRSELLEEAYQLFIKGCEICKGTREKPEEKEEKMCEDSCVFCEPKRCWNCGVEEGDKPEEKEVHPRSMMSIIEEAKLRDEGIHKVYNKKKNKDLER